MFQAVIRNILTKGRLSPTGAPVLWLAFGLAGLAQETGTIAPVPVAPLRISVASNVAANCGPGISPLAIQQSAEARLRGAGLTVSTIHNAQVVVEVDCMPVAARTRTAGFAIHQCLGLSEMVSSPSNSGKAMLANTWRNCQSFSCGANCEAAVRTGQQTLLESFLGEFQERHAAAISPQPRTSSPPSDALYTNKEMARIIVFSAYIIACLSLLCHWQLRKSSVRMF